MKKKKKNETTIASEPQVGYGKDIVFFKSFEEMNEYDDKQMANSSPEERIKNITWFIKRAYSEELNKKMDLIIHFK